MSKIRVLVTGAGGFIGRRLTSALVKRGYWVRGVDLKAPDQGESDAHDFQLFDLRQAEGCLIATQGIEDVYHLAADPGASGYKTTAHAAAARNNAMIDLNMLEAARRNGADRFLFASTQTADESREGRSLEKSFMETMCRYYREDYELKTRIVRLPAVYDPRAYDGGRRAVLPIDECVEALWRTMRSDRVEPIEFFTDERIGAAA